MTFAIRDSTNPHPSRNKPIFGSGEIIPHRRPLVDTTDPASGAIDDEIGDYSMLLSSMASKVPAPCPDIAGSVS
jgi:hypothetical protein